jgi:hypothetical protein
LCAAGVEERIRADHECTRLQLDQFFESRIDLALRARVQDMQAQAQSAGCVLQISRLNRGPTLRTLHDARAVVLSLRPISYSV